MNKGDVELLSNKIKSSEVFSENRIIWEKLGLTEKEVNENEEDSEEENGTEDEADIVEVVNDELSLLSAEELDILKKALAKEERNDEELMSSRIEKLYNLKNYPFNDIRDIVTQFRKNLNVQLRYKKRTNGTRMNSRILSTTLRFFQSSMVNSRALAISF